MYILLPTQHDEECIYCFLSKAAIVQLCTLSPNGYHSLEYL